MATATNPNLHTRTLDPLERVRVRVISRIRGPRWNERRRRGVGRGRNEEGNETPVFQRCCIHEAEWTDGRCTLEHELSLSPSVNAQLHGARTCPLAIYTEWPPVTWVLNTSIHARSGRIKASHVQFHGTKIFFRGISILLPAPLRRPRVKPLFGTPVWWKADFHAFPCRRVLICNTMHGEARARHTRIDIGYLVWLVTTTVRDEWQWGETMILTQKIVIRKFSLYADILILWSRRYNISRDEGFN